MLLGRSRSITSLIGHSGAPSASMNLEPSNHETLIQCCFNGDPTLKQHWINDSCLLVRVSKAHAHCTDCHFRFTFCHQFIRDQSIQQTRDVHPMWVWCWPSVADADPALKLLWENASWFQSTFCFWRSKTQTINLVARKKKRKPRSLI